jgi:hypothetical protein
MAYHLLSSFDKYPDIDVFVVILNEGLLADAIRKLSIPVFLLDEKKQSFAAIYMELRKIVLASQPDVIHSHRYKENILGFLVSLSVRKTRLLSTQHGMPEIYDRETDVAYRVKLQINNWVLLLRQLNISTHLMPHIPPPDVQSISSHGVLFSAVSS